MILNGECNKGKEERKVVRPFSEGASNDIKPRHEDFLGKSADIGKERVHARSVLPESNMAKRKSNRSHKNSWPRIET